MRTSLGIWAMGPMVTRFNPGGYKPELAGRYGVRTGASNAEAAVAQAYADVGMRAVIEEILQQVSSCYSGLHLAKQSYPLVQVREESCAY